ncbi:T9SS type A sorting domain-containing protein [Bacteroidia bacterium]|nr:T9SS type A sorting domain-containing protein [Bacteroidia bacterium]
MGFPTNYGYIINRPYVYGSYGIKLMLDTMANNGVPTPNYLLDNTTNQWNCLQQVTPSQIGHAIDDFWLRTSNTTTFFASKIDSCSTVRIVDLEKDINNISIFPNPSPSDLSIDLNKNYSQVEITLVSSLGQFIQDYTFYNSKLIKLDLNELDTGVYLMKIKLNNDVSVQRKITKTKD